MTKKLPVLASRSECTGCSACHAICSTKSVRSLSNGQLRAAITMLPDGEGFLYPVVDASLCVGCGRCEAVCPLLNSD